MENNIYDNIAATLAWEGEQGHYALSGVKRH